MCEGLFREREDVQAIAEAAVAAFWEKVRELAPLDVWEDTLVDEREAFDIAGLDAVAAWFSATSGGLAKLAEFVAERLRTTSGPRDDL